MGINALSTRVFETTLEKPKDIDIQVGKTYKIQYYGGIQYAQITFIRAISDSYTIGFDIEYKEKGKFFPVKRSTNVHISQFREMLVDLDSVTHLTLKSKYDPNQNKEE